MTDAAAPDANPDGLHPCARCARLQPTCCQSADVLVTAGDRARIGTWTGAADFWEHRRPADPEMLEHDPDDPEWLTLTVRPDGTRAMLRRRENGDCVFLGTRGCGLPGATRPLVCRLYPYAYTARGLEGDGGHRCPREVLAPGGEPMPAVLGMPPGDAERDRAQLYAELRGGSP